MAYYHKKTVETKGETRMRYGYHGKILSVDLSHSLIREETPDEQYYRRYTGGSLMATVKLLQETTGGLDAFDPKSYLMFFSGILSGMKAPGLARFVICGKSPATGGIGEARCEGPFAIALKKSGYDGIVIHGRAQVPSILVLEDGLPRIEAAPELWGKTVDSCEKVLQATYGGASTAIIGPAGENLVRYANVICDKSHQASRGGMGAVMGSKLLKAVVLIGGSLPPSYNPEALEKTGAMFAEKMQENVLSLWQHDRPGFGAWIHTHGIDAALCVNNYQSSECDYTDAYTPEKFAPLYRGEAVCPYCPNNCIKRYATELDDEQMGGLHQEALGALGPNLGNSDLEKIIGANVLCNEYGLDPNSLGFTISFAQECVQKGLLDPGALDLSFSAEVDLCTIIEKIVKREGIGDMLAEGASRAARLIGKEAEQYAMSVKNLEMTPFEARSQTNLALGFATASVGPRYDICEHDWDFDVQVGWDHSLEYCRTLGILDRIPMQYLGEDKVKNFKALNNLWSAVDALGMCLFATAPTRVYSLEDIARLYHDVTGFETSSYEVLRLGELRNHLFRSYNYREGLGPEDDMLPDRFFTTEINSGTMQGVKLDKKLFQQVIRFYYTMMGWDHKGRPEKATLYDFGLDWVDAMLP